MPIDVPNPDRILMSQKERDVLKVMHAVLRGERTQAEAARLIGMIDDATSRLLARFYPAATVEAHLDLLGRWVRRFGRPLALYTDRHSTFEPQDKGEASPEAETQFGRALRELGIGLILAHSPQATGRVERSFDTAQDRWVKELRLAGAATAAVANDVL